MSCSTNHGYENRVISARSLKITQHLGICCRRKT
jgi:hypothetical protein